MRALRSFLTGITLVSCGGCGVSGFSEDRYKEAVKDGFTKIPQACEIERLLGEADHFISYSGPRVKQDWNTEVYFGGRYCLTMQVDVKLNSDFSKILEVKGEPTFYLTEFTKVALNADGTTTGDPQGGESATFGLKEWKKIVQSGGDFTVVKLHIKKNQPVPNFDKFVEAARRPRIQVHPDCGHAAGATKAGSENEKPQPAPIPKPPKKSGSSR